MFESITSDPLYLLILGVLIGVAMLGVIILVYFLNTFKKIFVIAALLKAIIGSLEGIHGGAGKIIKGLGEVTSGFKEIVGGATGISKLTKRKGKK